jgi:hypothetical protein
VRHIREATDTPIVWDMHDLTPSVKPAEVVPHCDHVIVPSEGYKEALEKYDIPVSVVYSMVPKGWLQKPIDEKVNAGILVSGIDSPHGTVWRDYTEAQRSLPTMYIYAGVPLCVDGPHPMHAHYENLLMTAPYLTMLRQLSRYAWGYAGAVQAQPTAGTR